MRFRVTRSGTSTSFTEQKAPGEEVLSFAKDIRGAINWPSTPVPGYALIAAQKDFFEKGKFPLVLLAEICDSKPTIFFKRIFEVARRLSCRQFYAETWKAEYEGIVATFNDYASHHSQISIWLEEAPSQNLEFAFCLVQEWVEADAIEVDEGTILANQLEQAGQGDLRDAEQVLFAVKALSFLIASVEQQPWVSPNLFPSSGGRSRLGGVI